MPFLASSAGGAVADECLVVPCVTPSLQSSREKTAHLGPRSTLVICPLSVLSNWQVHKKYDYLNDRHAICAVGTVCNLFHKLFLIHAYDTE